MRWDRWIVVGAAGAVVACLSCLTPFAVVAIAAIGLGAWTGYLDIVAGVLFVACVALIIYRYRLARRRASRRAELRVE
jgi:mercuric ion transport protein